MKKSGTIRAGIGGWTFEPWRGTFYPEGSRTPRSSSMRAAHLPTIEVNGTFYRTQTPATFAKWASETPDGFVFALKGPRYAVNRRVLAEAGDCIKRFLNSGPTRLGDKLGPMLWQFAPTKKFDEADFGAFLELLPAKFDGRAAAPHGGSAPSLVRACRRSSKLLREHGVAVIFAEHETYPAIADVTGRLRLRAAAEGQGRREDGYAPKALDAWAKRVRTWAEGGVPSDLDQADPKHKTPAKPRDVFVYFIHEGKVRAPHAAIALMSRLDKA